MLLLLLRICAKLFFKIITVVPHKGRGEPLSHYFILPGASFIKNKIHWREAYFPLTSHHNFRLQNYLKTILICNGLSKLLTFVTDRVNAHDKTAYTFNNMRKGKVVGFKENVPFYKCIIMFKYWKFINLFVTFKIVNVQIDIFQ